MMPIKPFTYILFLITFFISESYSQKVLWDKTLGGSSNDWATSIIQTQNNNYLCGGSSFSDVSGNKTVSNWGWGLNDFWVVMLDSNLTILWQQVYGGNGSESLEAIIETSDGGFVLGGTSDSDISGNKSDSSKGGNDFWIVKIDAFGIIQWQTSLGGSANDEFTAMALSGDGGIFCGGSSTSNISGNKTGNRRGGCDYWVVKLDSLGNILWQKTFGGWHDDILTSLSATKEGGCIAGGSSWSHTNGDKTSPNKGLYDYWVVKFDSSGTVQWQRSFGGTSGDHCTGIIQLLNGYYFCGGNSSSSVSGDKNQPHPGAWFLYLDSVGNIQNQAVLGVSDPKFIQLPDSNIIVLGANSTFNRHRTERPHLASNSDYWLAKISTSFKIIWQNALGGSNDESPYCISLTNDGDFLCAGKSSSSSFADKTENGFGQDDQWILRVTEKTNRISGRLFYDLNGNHSFNAGDIPIAGERIIDPLSKQFVITKSDGMFDFNIFSPGTFTLAPKLNSSTNYFQSFPTSHTVTFNNILQASLQNNFALVANFNIPDLSISSFPLGPFRENSFANYLVQCSNKGSVPISNFNIVFRGDNRLSYISSTLSPSLVSTDSVLWTISQLNPFDNLSFLIRVQLNHNLPLGTIIQSIVETGPIAGDQDLSDNISFTEVPVVIPWFANRMAVNKNKLAASTFPNPLFLEYTISFQNIWFDTARNVRIFNPVDTNFLDPKSFEFVASSHPCLTQWINWESNLEFRFDNIQLPNSTVNEAESHGFIKYRLRPQPNLIAGDTIPNFAAIYFNDSLPIVTPPVLTMVVLTTQTDNAFNVHSLKLLPNPASDKVHIFSPSVKTKNIDLFDMTGKLIKSWNLVNEADKHEINISDLNPGIFIIRIVSSEGNFSGKLLKLAN